MRHYAMTVSLPEARFLACRVKDHFGTFAYAAPSYLALIQACGVVGHVHFDCSPLGDRLYVYKLNIEPTNRRQGLPWRSCGDYIFSSVYIWCPSNLPVRFWRSATVTMGRAGAHLSTALESAESARWALLEPSEEALPRLGKFSRSNKRAGILRAIGVTRNAASRFIK